MYYLPASDYSTTYVSTSNEYNKIVMYFFHKSKIHNITLDFILHIALFNIQSQTYLSKSASKDYDDAKKTKAEEAFISFAVSVPNPMDGLRRIDPNMVYQFFQKNLDILKFGLILATFIWSKS